MIFPESCLPDTPDIRDHVFTAPLGARLPARIDLRREFSAIEDQENVNSCVGNAAVGVMEFLNLRAGKPHTELSRLFVYFVSRALRGWQTLDKGTFNRDCMRALKRYGVCREDLWAYDTSKVFSSPPPAAYVDAKNNRVTSYARLGTLQDVKAALADGWPVQFGFTVYGGYVSRRFAETGELLMPNPGDYPRGGHAVVAAGYDDTTQRLLVRDSQGRDRGQKGYFTMPYAYAENRGLTHDFWLARSE